MDIGTAKPTAEQRATTAHHLVDMMDPDEDYSLALFLRQAREAIQAIQSRSRLPIVAGGTGQYVRGLIEGWQVPEVSPDPTLRGELERKARVEGAAELYRELCGMSPVAARHVDPRNVRRVVRALEVCYSSPEIYSRASRMAPEFNAVVVGLTLDRGDLYRRIDQRVDDMVQAGWVAEVEGLMARGYDPILPSMSSLGYRELAEYLSGKKSLETAVEEIKRRTRRFARKQYAWFHPEDERIRWFQGTDAGLDTAVSVVREVLGQ